MNQNIECRILAVKLIHQGNILANVDVLLNGIIEMRDFTIIKNDNYPNPIVKSPSTHFNNKFKELVIINDPETKRSIHKKIMDAYEEEING